MKRSRFTEDQIIGILKEHEAGVSVADPRLPVGVPNGMILHVRGPFQTSFFQRRPGLRPRAALPFPNF